MRSSKDGKPTAVDGGPTEETQSEPEDLPDGVDRVEILREPGVKVVDREDNSQDPDTAVVINSPPATCEEWNAYYDEDNDRWVSIAEDNPDYDPESPVVVVAFLPAIEESDTNIRPVESPVQLKSLDINHYSFPPNRLKIVETPDHVDVEPVSSKGESTESGGRGSANRENTNGESQDNGEDTVKGDAEDIAEKEPQKWDLTNGFKALRDRLAESATVEVEHTQAGPVLAVEKLGTSYRIQEDGTVSGDGALRDRLDSLVEEYL
ncbi:hypothetical protein SAMN05216388_10094 [Halorientalis persicus]|uniref:Uncharacterized protein n=1 Tax=Halorientalis persicus TaxID=1367881 RepID=A0A1H8MIA6_9EURY|nr:hypothetical protein [Halorientalis persicus]SEO16948.1 hypothetical protein SAMN05216388_10094 [Halorientalis persicus]